MISSLQSMNTATRPNFLLLKEICATVLSLDTYIDTKIQLGYDADYRLCSTHRYQSGSMTNAATYRKNTLELLDMVAYRADGQVTQTHAYSYNENGKLLTITGMDAAGVVCFSKNHCYDRNGILNYSEVRHNGKLHYWESFHNDQYGLRDSYISGDAQRKLIQVYQYQNVMEKGRLAKVVALQNGELRHTVFYNDAGKPVKEVRFDHDQQEMDVTQYIYSENGAPLLETRSHYGEEVFRAERSYDETGHLMEIRRIRHGQLEQKVQYAYLDGRLLGYQSYTCGQLDAHYTYIYEPVYISDAQAKVLSGLYAKFVTQ